VRGGECEERIGDGASVPFAGPAHPPAGFSGASSTANLLSFPVSGRSAGRRAAGLSESLLDRLLLTPSRLESIAYLCDENHSPPASIHSASQGISVGIKLARTFTGRKSETTNPTEAQREFLMAGTDNLFESHPSIPEPPQDQDQGGMRSGRERRKGSEPHEGSERRSGRDRRRGFDRRSGIERRRSNGRRNGRYFRDGDLVERRDVFRRHIQEN